MSTNAAVEFLIWLLIAASVIAVLAARLRIPYTVALVVGGLVLEWQHILVAGGIRGALRQRHVRSSRPRIGLADQT